MLLSLLVPAGGRARGARRRPPLDPATPSLPTTGWELRTAGGTADAVVVTDPDDPTFVSVRVRAPGVGDLGPEARIGLHRAPVSLEAVVRSVVDVGDGLLLLGEVAHPSRG